MDIKIEKRHVYILVSLIILSTGILFVRGQSSNFGHSGDDVIVTVGGVDKTLNEALNEGGIANAECATARVIEDSADLGIAYIIDTTKKPNPYAGDASLVVKTPAIYDQSSSFIPNMGGDYFGTSCQDGWIMTGCGHASDNGDSDFLLAENGCFADMNDGSKSGNFLDLRCCKF